MEDVKRIYQANYLDKSIFLNTDKVKYFVKEFVSWLFCINEEFVDFNFFKSKEDELKQVLRSLLKVENHSNIDETVEEFFKNLFRIHQLLLGDLKAILEFDPAAKSKNEVILAYPGFFAIVVYRLAHELSKKGVQLLPRLMTEYAHSKTGIDIHPAATIGKQFFIDHGTGIVIGETTIVGNNVKIYQGVTLGALSVDKNHAKDKRHPTIEDDVILYSNATILGENTIIGKGSIIGGNVWITNSIPPQSVVFYKSEIVIKSKRKFPEAINFSI